MITSTTNSQGNAGDITVNAGSIDINNSQIKADLGVNFTGDVNFVDTELFLFDAVGNLLAENDDSDIAAGAGGSNSGLDSFIQFTFPEDGTYIIGVGAFSSFAEGGVINGSAIANKENYTLQVSLGNQITSGANGLINKDLGIENDSLATAQDINGSFSINEDPNIQDSTSIPHVSIDAEGDGTFDYYSFNATAGSLGIFDIDNTGIGAGNITLNVTNGDININGGSLISSSAAVGNVDVTIPFAPTTAQGGNVNIVTPDLLTIQDGSRIQVISGGEAISGNISINSGSLTLDQGRISAQTESGKGGLLNINVDDNLLMRNNSQITTNAGSNGNGGDININAKFIIGFPSTGLGNDIRANAGQGRGGNINIEAKAVLGFEESRLTVNQENDINDIDASSELGPQFSGTVNINVPDTNPLQGVDRLPTNPVSAETIATEACSPGGGGSSLTYKGKGGIPPEPTAPFSADALIPDGKPITIDKKTDLNSLLEGEIEQEPENPNYITADIKPIKTSMGDIYPARGIVKTEDGKIILTRYPTDNINTRTPHKSANCSLLKDEG